MSLRVALLLPLLLLAACQPATPPPAPPAPAPATACFLGLPSGELKTPVSDVNAQELSAPALDEAAQRCIGALLGEQPFATPLRFDAAYATVQQAHGEDASLYWSSTPRRQVQLLRISRSATASAWLLRIDTGLEMEGARYDLLLTVDAQGRLLDQLLAGADGVLYRRSLSLPSSSEFRLDEQGGREEQPGPRYHARFRVDDSGRIGLVPGAQAANAAAAAPDPGESATSLEEVPGAAGDAEAIRQLLFSDSGVLEEVVQRHSLTDGSLAMLAVGRTESAGLIAYVFRPVPGSSNGKTRYQVASLTLPEPAQAVGGELGKIEWQADKDGAAVVLPMRYDLVREGGNADSGEAETQATEVRLRLRYDSARGALRREVP